MCQHELEFLSQQKTQEEAESCGLVECPTGDTAAFGYNMPEVIEEPGETGTSRLPHSLDRSPDAMGQANGYQSEARNFHDPAKELMGIHQRYFSGHDGPKVNNFLRKDDEPAQIQETGKGAERDQLIGEQRSPTVTDYRDTTDQDMFKS